VISQFTDAYTAKGAYQLDKLVMSTLIIENILSTWTGLIYFSVGNRQSIYAIIEALSLPDTEVRNILLKSLDRIFGVQFPKTKLWDKQFYSMRLMAFIDAGLIEALVAIITEGEESSCSIVLNMLSEIFMIAGSCLPKSCTDRVLALPNLFRPASDFKNESSRHVMRDKFFTIFESHLKQLTNPGTNLTYCIAMENQAESVRGRLNFVMDDLFFKNLIVESEV
jgi:large subunit ribosomal protein L17e